MNKAKKLTQSSLNKLDAGLNEKKVIYLEDAFGDSHECQIDAKFRKTKMQKLGLEYLEYLRQLKTQTKVDEDTIISIPVLLYGLACKHFTNLPIKFKNLEELTNVTKILLDQGFIDQLFSGDSKNGFDPLEVSKLQSHLNLMAKSIGQTVGELAYISTMNESDEDEIVEIGELDNE